MRKLLMLLAFVCAMLPLAGCGGSDGDRTRLQFLTEEYRPLNYTESGELKGLAADLLRRITGNLGVPFDVAVVPWEEGYRRALTEDNTVLFSTALNAQRKDLFKWAGPIASIDWFFYAASPAVHAFDSLEDAKTTKSIRRIGVVKNYAIEQYLVEQGFTNLVQVADNREGFRKLLDGEINLFAAEKVAAEAALGSINESIWSVEPVLTIVTDLVYFAFNRKIPDEVVAEYQREIDRSKADGTLLALYKKYLQSTDPPAEFQLLTEQYPPLNQIDLQGEASGFSVDIVREIMRRNDTVYPIRMSTWSSAYELVRNNPNAALFSMERIPLREESFHWVGPLGQSRTYLFTLAGSGISIASLQDAKNLASIGTVNAWSSDQYLRQQGFTNLTSFTEPRDMIRRLLRGKLQAIACSDITLPYLMAANGDDYGLVIPSLEIMSSSLYVAFSKTTPEPVVARWQRALDAMKQDGTYQAIQRRYFTN